MGAALGYAISQPVVIALCVFSALGLGMALPYVLVAVVPGFARLLPKPGRWMESLKQLMAFPILATVIWMVWVLGRIAGPDAALAAWVSLLLVGMSAWIFGRWNGLLARVICILVFGAGVFVLYKAPVSVASSQATLQYGWEPYSKAKLMEYLDLGQPVFVDFTADWCVTCKVNERVALKSTQVLQSFRDHGVHVLVADWTHSDPEITQALMNFGRNGVPLYLLYSGVRGDEPKILPQILTPALMLRELERLR
jgi:thiol:disulfide interchange protein DsbD